MRAFLSYRMLLTMHAYYVESTRRLPTRFSLKKHFFDSFNSTSVVVVAAFRRELTLCTHQIDRSCIFSTSIISVVFFFPGMLTSYEWSTLNLISSMTCCAHCRMASRTLTVLVTAYNYVCTTFILSLLLCPPPAPLLPGVRDCCLLRMRMCVRF